jgi:hypothetical protein
MRAVFLFLRALHGKPLSIFSCACVGSCCRRASCSFISTPFICRQHPCSLVALLRGSARRKRFEGQPSCRCCTQSQRRSSFVCCTSKGSISLLLSLRRQFTCKVSFGAANAEWIRVASKWITTQLVRFKGCDPGSSLGHAHPHGGASTSSTSANGLAVSPSRAPRAAAIAARRACAGRVHAAVR